MKSVLSNKCCEKKELPYPKLKEGKYSGNIGLFKDALNAVYIYHCDSSNKIGDAIPQNNIETNFVDYEGDVCLTNEEV